MTTNNNCFSKNECSAILDLDYKRYDAICKCLDFNPDLGWRSLVASLDGTKFALKEVEREECARVLYQGLNVSPSNQLLQKLNSKGMSLQTLAYYLDKSKMEKCLMYIKAHEPLLIKQQPPESLVVDCGSKLEIVCIADGFPYPEYVWYKENKKIFSDKAGRYVIKESQTSDAGMYTCRVQHHTKQDGWLHVFSTTCSVLINKVNNCSVKSNSVLDGVSYSKTTNQEMSKMELSCPQIIVQPTSQSNSYGGLVIFKVKAQHRVHNHECLMYQWFFNRVPINGAIQNELRLDDIRREDEGRYQVRVFCQRNQSSEILSNEVVLDVKRIPNQYTARNKVALIIGNASYRTYGYPLPAVRPDMFHTTKLFEEMGFKVISLLDLTLSEMKRAVACFCNLLSENSYVIMYFLGHGYMYQHMHCLIPWDSSLGNDVNESLCIENCIEDVQVKKPKLVLVLVDICRQQVEHSRESQFETKPSSQCSLPNLIVLYAASVNEKSFETSSRGLFNRYLLEVLEEPNVTINKVYGMLKKKFQNCPFDPLKYPQSPEMRINLEDPDRSLWDPIDSDNKFCSKEEVLWQQIHVIPKNIHIQLPDKGLVILSFIKKLSNVLTMKVNIVNFNTNHSHIKVQLPNECVDQVLRPVNEYSDDSNVYFDFFNLQRLTKSMTLCLTITIENMKDQSDTQQFKTQLINLGNPFTKL